jgi:nitrite reductase/ring-hydroxylating ferredoxin subunit
MKHLVGKRSDFAANAFAVVTLEGREIAIWNDGTRFRAFRNACPHRGAPLSSGVVSGTYLPSRAKELCYGLEGQVLRCPWHGYEYSLETGEPLFGVATQRLVTYEVTVDDDGVFVELKAARPLEAAPA